jgi:S1-C subfamily serine protease
MRLATWSCALVALVALCLPQARADETKKDEEAKGKIPEATRKKLEHNKVTFGAFLLDVAAGSPATDGSEKGKGTGGWVCLEKGDIITHIDGKPVRTAADYHKLMSGNDERKITVIDVNSDVPTTYFFKPKAGCLGIKFEIITPPLG